jgi:hypothetical protein
VNLVFHTVFSISASSICAKKIVEDNRPLKYLTLGFIGNLVGHGIMDIIPHDYPLTLKTDIPISFAIFLLSMILVNKRYITSVLFCFLGGVLPDLIDKAFFPIIGLRYLKVFPWHWSAIINFFYKWYTPSMFKVFNILAIIVSFALLLVNVKFIVHHMLKYIKIADK